MKTKFIFLILIISCLAGCGKSKTNEMIEAFAGEAELKKSMPVLSFINEEATDDSISVFMGEEIKDDNVFLQVNAICRANYYEFPGSSDATFINSEEKYLKYANVNDKITVTKMELEKLFEEFILKNKQTGHGLGITEFSYEIKVRSVKYVNEKWYAGEWAKLDDELTQNLSNSEYEIEIKDVKKDDDTNNEAEFANSIQGLAKEKEIDKFLDVCHYPLYINDKVYSTKDEVIESEIDIWKDYFIESISQADPNNVLQKEKQYILTSSEYAEPNIIFEKINNNFLVTEINQ